MRNQKNFRGQSGRPSPIGGGSRATMKIFCHCSTSTVDDLTGAVTHGFRICEGTATAGVADCSCCTRSKGGGATVSQGLFGG